MALDSVEGENGARLDRATFSRRLAEQGFPGHEGVEDGPWLATEYPEAGEASVVWASAEREPREFVPAGEAVDGERAMREASRRAATKIRRYATANGCDRLWSLTYDEEHVPETLGDVWTLHAERFRERLFALQGERFPLVLVPERGSESGRPHVHALTNRYLPEWQVKQAWGCGYVAGRRVTSYRDFKTGEAVVVRSLGGKARCRAAAGYLVGYVKKGFLEDHEFGRHRYSTTRGFDALSRQARFCRRGQATAWCSMTMPGELVEEWASSMASEWVGPPVWVGYWDDG